MQLESQKLKKPKDLQRWEDEGGAPPPKPDDSTRRNFRRDPGPHIVKIIRRLIKGWREPMYHDAENPD